MQQQWLEALQRNENDLTALVSLGAFHLKAASYAQAAAYFSKAVLLAPEEPSFYCNLGLCLFHQQHYDQALVMYDRALELSPDYIVALNNKAEAHRLQGDVAAAIDCYTQLMTLEPRNPEPCAQLALTLAMNQQLDQALRAAQAAQTREPLDASTCLNLAYVYRQAMQLEKATSFLQRAIAIAPDDAAAYVSLSGIELLSGQLHEGWKHYEYRWKLPQLAPYLNANRGRLLWNGEQPLQGRSILVRSEQGLGDTIQFFRYIHALSQQGAHVHLETQAPLVQLFRQQNIPHLTVTAQGDALPETDYYTNLMSLAQWFESSDLQGIHGQPYLQADAAQAAAWNTRLGTPLRVRIGLVWSGGFRKDAPQLRDVNERRNMPLTFLSYLQDINADFYSLQKGEPAESELQAALHNNWRGPALIQVSPLLQDFSDTAALITQLDLVIAVDTSTAHLAGALGKPVWLLNRFDTCWRWFLDRADSPWYQRMRIYRQATPGDWAGVMQRVHHDLVQWLDQQNEAEDFHKALAFHQQGQWTLAQAHYQRVIERNPLNASAHSNLGAVYRQLNQLDQALQSYMKAVELRPTKWDEYVNYALILYHLDRHDKALEICDFAIAQGYDNEHSQMVRAGILVRLDRDQEAIDILLHRLQQTPDHADAQWLLANLQLKQGHYQEGWSSYEARWRIDGGVVDVHPERPKWQGEPLQGRTLLVYAEQGQGDTIQFCRYVPFITSKGARVIFQVPASLQRLMQGAQLGADCIRMEDDPGPVDFAIPLMSLPRLFNTTLDTIPARIPYLHADDTQSTSWRTRLATFTPPLKVGIVWSGGERADEPLHYGANVRRNMRLLDLEPLMEVPVQWVSLQLGPPLQQWSQAPDAFHQIFNPAAELHDFADTAALINALDLVISVDTAVIHLAGALGKPAWLLNRHDTCWRWLLQRSDSPWYPSLRIYRQSSPGDWRGVVEQVREDLLRLVAQPLTTSS